MLKLEGRIVGPWVDELRQTWTTVVKQSDAKSVKVDMKAVSYADRRGASLLREMEGQGASLVYCSDFIQQQVHADPSPTETARKKSK